MSPSSIASVDLESNFLLLTAYCDTLSTLISRNEGAYDTMVLRSSPVRSFSFDLLFGYVLLGSEIPEGRDVNRQRIIWLTARRLSFCGISMVRLAGILICIIHYLSSKLAQR